MSLLRAQKKLQKKFYETNKAEAEVEKAMPKSVNGRINKGQVYELERLVEEDIASYKGLPIGEKIAIKKKLVKKYEKSVQQLLESPLIYDRYSLMVNGYIIWLYDIGDIEGFLNTIDKAISLSLEQQIIQNKDYRLMRLYWVLDWTAEQRDKRLSYEPYLSRVFESIKDWDLPKKIKEGYWYFRFYSLLAQGKLDEALKTGEEAIEHGAGIKTNLEILKSIQEGKVKKTWDVENWKFVSE